MEILEEECPVSVDSDNGNDLVQRELHGYLVGPLVVNDNLAVHGFVDGDVCVKCGGVFVLWGLVQGSVFVAPLGEASINGVVNGEVHNFGGDCKIFDAIVDAVIDHDPRVTTFIYPVANVRGRNRGCS